MTKEDKCPFCSPKDRVLKSNKYAIVLLSNPRKTPGHFLVTPKRHIEKPWELTKDELEGIFNLIFFIEKKITGKLGDGCDIRQNYRPFMPQSKLKVNHIHFHVIPRRLKDHIYLAAEKHETDLFLDLSDDEAAMVTKLLE